MWKRQVLIANSNPAQVKWWLKKHYLNPMIIFKLPPYSRLALSYNLLWNSLTKKKMAILMEQQVNNKWEQVLQGASLVL